MMLDKLIWCAMHSRYFSFVQIEWRSLIPIDWQLQSDYRGHWRLEVWTIKRPDPVYFPWECDRGFKTRNELKPWQPPPLPISYDKTAPDYDDIPF